METQSAARAPAREIALYFRATKVESYGRVQRTARSTLTRTRAFDSTPAPMIARESIN